MRKVLRGISCILLTNIKFVFMKIFRFNRFHFHFLHLIRPLSEFDISIKSYVKLGKMIRTGKYCRVRVRENAKLEMGDNSGFNDGCILVCHDNIRIGNNVQFGPNCLIYDHDHDYKNEKGLKKKKYITKPIEIEDNVWIGANSLILKGVKIGHDSVIAAGSVVTKDVPSNSVLIQKRENF